MGNCSFGFLCGRSIMANFYSEISGSIRISFQSCVSSPSQVCGAADAQGAGTGCWSWAHLLYCENTLLQAASQSCLTASQTLCTKSKQSSPRKPALNVEYLGNCSAVVAIRKLSLVLSANCYYEWGAHRDTTAVKWISKQIFQSKISFCFEL